MTNNLIYILIAAVIAILLAAFFYLYRSKNKNRTTLLLFALRAISFFLLFLLLFNIKINKRILKNQKPNLVVLMDDSKSIKFLNKEKSVKSFYQKLKTSKDLHQKFQVQFFSFGNDLTSADSLHFNHSETNIYQALQKIKSNNTTQKTPVILITDGNQTKGKSYDFFKSNLVIFPVVVGDTTSYQDVFIDQLNANKYAYLKHKFPIETFIGYTGNKSNLPVTFTITEGKSVIYKKKFEIGKNNNSKEIQFYIPANKIGLHHYKAQVSSIESEKNTINNQFYFSVVVISEKSEILMISDIIHPDIAMFKRAIETNEQRKFTLKKPTDQIDISKYSCVILYQPQANFKTLYNQILNQKKNLFFITGAHTNWSALNDLQPFFKRNFLNKNENYNAVFNSDFNTFLLDNIGFENLPPLQDKFGEITFNVPFQTILFQKINGFVTEQPLMASFKDKNQKYLALFGENSWRWRMYHYKDNQNFNDFDTFINKTIQYLSTTNSKEQVELTYKKKYFSNEKVPIKAQVFDVNYQFNPNKKMWIKISGGTKPLTYPLALEGSYYQVELSDLNPGFYTFTVFDKENAIKKSGSFTILNYEIEQQNNKSNIKSLTHLAKNNSGKVYFLNDADTLISDLKNNTDYKTIQKQIVRKKSLIDWRLLLAIVSILLAIEWFIRKYKGLV